MKNVFLYTGTEAIALIKEYFPNSWEKEVNEKKAIIIRLKKLYKLEDYKAAYKKYISYGCREESAIISLAALQLLLDEEKELKESTSKQVEELRTTMDKLILQQESMEKSNEPDKDKRTLRQYYRQKLDTYSKQVDELVNSIQVVDAIVLRIQGNLFEPTSGQ